MALRDGRAEARIKLITRGAMLQGRAQQACRVSLLLAETFVLRKLPVVSGRERELCWKLVPANFAAEADKFAEMRQGGYLRLMEWRKIWLT